MFIGFPDPENMGVDTTFSMFAHFVTKLWEHFNF